MTSTELATLNRFRNEIERLESIPDAVTAANKLDAIQYALKKAGHTQRIQNEAAAMKLRAERKAGELIVEAVPDTPGRRDAATPTFADLGVKPQYGNKLRKLANIPADLFEKYLENAYVRGDEITRSEALRLHPVKPREQVHAFEFVAPSIPEEIAHRVAGTQGEELAELIAASIEGALKRMVDSNQSRQAFIWAKRHGVDANGEVGDTWPFAGIAKMVPNEKGEPSTREYVEAQYYRAHSSVMAQLASDALQHLHIAVQGLI